VSHTTTATVTTTVVASPVGPVRLAVAGAPERLVALAFDDHFERIASRVKRRLPGPWAEGPTAAGAALAAYLAGDLDALDAVEVDLVGTPFQQRVWATLRSIPVGSTWTYAQVAAAVGSPAAVRAVGAASGANPVWLAVPCHRVVRGDGGLGGYAGGLDRKAWLLTHESAGG
jgi:methylated-DNA-[protein]-cysteine S-methyltransferase